jgi:YVTN family beta-propeller protein
MRHHRFFPHCAPFATVTSIALLLAAIGCRDEAAVARRDSAELAALDSSTSLAAANAARRERDKKTNIYAATDTDGLSAAVRAALPRAYVPNSLSASVTVIDQSTHRVLRTFATGKVPQHVVPAYDLKTLLGVEQLGQ